MLDNTVTILNFKVDLVELQNYYKTLNQKYQYLNWSWKRCGNDIVDQWRDAAYADPDNLLTHGWAIQSNLKDVSLPCPPWNISKHETVEYRNTELVFGIVERLQQQLPFAYRWAISVQPCGGKVSLHSDQEDECTVWIPIHSIGTAVTFVNDNKNEEYCLDSNGSVYLLDTTIPHYTYNPLAQDRVTIIFRLNTKYLPQLLEVQGLI